jgi:hypothetical protein
VIVPNVQTLGLINDLENSTSGYLSWHTGIVSQTASITTMINSLGPQYSRDDGRKCNFSSILYL